MVFGSTIFRWLRRDYRVARSPYEIAYTLVELLITLALVGVLASLLVPELLGALHRTKEQRTVADLTRIDFELDRFFDQNEAYPESLDEIGLGGLTDPWGRDYVYHAHVGPGWRGRARKDRFLVPLNSDFDLYSVGPDGESRPPLVAPVSHDDIVRAADGLYFGPADEF